MTQAIRPRTPRALPAEQVQALTRAEHLSWWTLLLIGGVSVLMYAVMGGSEAMKTALVEDLLSLLSPLCFLVAAGFHRRAPDTEYINGRARAFDVTFLVSAVALTGVGLSIVWDSLHTLLRGQHPILGTVAVGNHLVWQGWLMIGSLVISAIPPVILGHKKQALARLLSLKTLHADADTSKADWMTALTGVLGVIGIGLGLWWADAAAALAISASVLKDGLRNLRSAMRDMHDARPQRVQGDQSDPLPEQVRQAVLKLAWIEQCQVRLHEEGFRISGAVFIAPRSGGQVDARMLREVHRCALAVHWRIDEIVVTLLGEEPRAS
ncbi:MAG: cation transporter [Pseudoxanthomonas sp.]